MSDIMVNGLSEKTNISEILNSEGKYKKKPKVMYQKEISKVQTHQINENQMSYCWR